MADKIQARIEQAGEVRATSEPASEPKPRAAEVASSSADGQAEAVSSQGAGSRTDGALQSVPQPEGPQGAASQEPVGDAAQPSKAGGDAWERLTGWFAKTFPHSRNAVLGGLAGLACALLLFTIGIIKTLVIAVLVLAGVAVGQYLDGDPKLATIIQTLIKKK